MITILAEKPSVAQEIAVHLHITQRKNGYWQRNGYAVTWALGHLVGLAMPEAYGYKGFQREHLPMLPDNFKLVPRQKKATKGYKDDERAVQQLAIIEDLFNQSEKIIVATDAGREGELIFRYIYNYLNCKVPFDRLWISSLTEKAIAQGFDNLKKGSEFDNLYQSAKARSEADWYIYIQLSYKILATLEDFKEIQENKDKTIDDLNKFKGLLISNQEILSYFPAVRNEFYSFLGYVKVDKSNQSIFIEIFDKLNAIRSNINVGEEHISYIQQKCLTGNETIIAEAKDLFCSVYNELSIREVQNVSKKIKAKVDKLETIIINYELEQDKIRKEQEQLKQEDRLRREEEERQRLAEEERLRKDKRKELILNIVVWLGIILAVGTAVALLIIYVIIPVYHWIVDHIGWIIAGVVAILAFIGWLSSRD